MKGGRGEETTFCCWFCTRRCCLGLSGRPAIGPCAPTIILRCWRSICRAICAPRDAARARQAGVRVGVEGAKTWTSGSERGGVGQRERTSEGEGGEPRGGRGPAASRARAHVRVRAHVRARPPPVRRPRGPCPCSLGSTWRGCRCPCHSHLRGAAAVVCACVRGGNGGRERAGGAREGKRPKTLQDMPPLSRPGRWRRSLVCALGGAPHRAGKRLGTGCATAIGGCTYCAGCIYCAPPGCGLHMATWKSA